MGRVFNKMDDPVTGFGSIEHAETKTLALRFALLFRLLVLRSMDLGFTRLVNSVFKLRLVFSL